MHSLIILHILSTPQKGALNYDELFLATFSCFNAMAPDENLGDKRWLFVYFSLLRLD